MRLLKDIYYKKWESNRKDKLKPYENLSDFNLTLVKDEFNLSKLSTKPPSEPKFSFGDRGVTLKTIEENEEIIANAIEFSFSAVFTCKSQAFELKCYCEIYDSTTSKSAYLDLYGRETYPENHPAYEKLNVICFWMSNRLLASVKKQFGKNGDVFKLLGKQNCAELVSYLKYITNHQPVGL